MAATAPFDDDTHASQYEAVEVARYDAAIALRARSIAELLASDDDAGATPADAVASSGVEDTAAAADEVGFEARPPAPPESRESVQKRFTSTNFSALFGVMSTRLHRLSEMRHSRAERDRTGADAQDG